MPPDLTRLHTISRQPSLDDYDPKRHAVPLNSILNSDSHEDGNAVRLPLQELHLNITPDDDNSEGSSTIRLAHVASGKIREVSLSTGRGLDCTENSNVINISELCNSQIEANTSPNNSSATEASDHDRDPLLCEAVLRSIFAQSSSGRSIEERLRYAEVVKRTFCLQGSGYREAEARAGKAAQYRRAEVRAQLEALQQDKGWSLYPAQFDDFALYESCKLEEMKELCSLEAYLAKLPSFSGSVQVCILSAEHLNTSSLHCIKPIACHRRPDVLRVYCSVTVVPFKAGMTSGGNFGQEVERCPNHLTGEVVYAGNAEWHDESPWIPVNSVHDQISIEVWSKKAPSRLYKGSKEGDSGLYRGNRSSRRRKVSSWSGDLFLGQVVVSVGQIEAQALSSGSIWGKAPLMSYPLMNARGQKDMSTIRLQFACSCEHLYSDEVPDKSLLKPPLNDLERAYDALVQVAFSTHLEGEFQLEGNWRSILGCFESYYRLRRERCCLGIVMHLAQMFQQDADYMSSVVEEWLPACRAAKEEKLTKPELALHSNIVALLVKPSVDAIEDFQSVFPANKPRGALSKLIELLALALCWDPNPDEIIVPIRSWIKVSCERRFQKYLPNSSVEGETKEITSKSLTAAICLLPKDLNAVGTCYRNVFPKDIALLPMCTSIYYRLVSRYITGFVRATALRIFTKDVADLAAELFLLHQDLERLGVAVDLLDLHDLFKDHILQLVATMNPRMIDWISSSISDEKWEPISPQTAAFFSFSVVDLYFMINGVVEEMTTRLSSFPFGNYYFPKMEKSICTAVGNYIQVTEKLCLQEVANKLNGEPHGFLTRFKSIHIDQSICISKALCVKLNNLHAVLKQQMALEANLAVKWQNHLQPSLEASKLNDILRVNKPGDIQRNVETTENGNPLPEERVGHHFENLHCLVEQSINNVMGSIVESMQDQLTKGLQNVMERCSADGHDSNLIEDSLQLTTYLDEHLKVFNEWLEPEVLKRLILEIAGALLFCMEEFALNRDEDPNPMTPKQRHRLEETLNFFYDYFYGDGVGICKAQMDHASARLRKILVCSDLNTRDLCSLYWKAWDTFNKDNYDQSCHVNRHSPVGDDDVEVATDVHLHLLDFLLLLQQRDDDEAKVIVANQKLVAKNKMMQFIFGFPQDEEMVASYACRNSRKLLGTLYITAKHVCFADASMVAPDNRRLFILPFERIMRINAVGGDSVLIVPFHRHPEHFSRFSDCDSVCWAIYNQVIGTGMFLEKYMAPFWAEATGNNPQGEDTYLQRFRCRKQGLISKSQGCLIVSSSFLIFEPNDKKKRIHVEHGAVSQIHAERRGLRASGVVIELKTGDSLEFVDFMDMNLPAKDIAQELQRLVLGENSRGFL